MTDKPLKILILSSMGPAHSANLGQDTISALRKAGHEVDFLTIEDNSIPVKRYYLYLKLRRAFHKLYLRLRKISKKTYLFVKDYYFPCIMENRPPVPSSIITNAIRRKYDLMITLFWQDMLTSKSLYDIYKKTGMPIIIQPVDMFPITGGCFYPGSCGKFIDGCKDCQLFKTKNAKEQIESNWALKKEIYHSIRCAFTSNSYMLSKFSQSKMLEGVQMNYKSIVINEDTFKQRDISSARKRLGIPEEKTFIIMARSVPFSPEHERKGIKYLIESINDFCKDLPSSQLNQMLLLLVGRGADELAQRVPIDTLDLGIVDQDRLIDTYSASTVFMSTTVDDAGPSMVNQSIMCSTPVLCFHIGTAIDVIKHKENGYKVDLCDVKGLTEGLRFINDLSDEEYIEFRKNTRRIAMEYNSMKAYSDAIESIYNQLIS